MFNISSFCLEIHYVMICSMWSSHYSLSQGLQDMQGTDELLTDHVSIQVKNSLLELDDQVFDLNNA